MMSEHQMDDLMPLPVGEVIEVYGGYLEAEWHGKPPAWGSTLYTADQMREYAKKAVEAAGKRQYEIGYIDGQLSMER